MPVNLGERITALLEGAVARGEIPCVNVLVVQHGQEVCYAQAGQDLATGRPVTRDTIFRLYSQTKPVTAAAVALLMERGELDLCDPVEKYLPGFHGQKVITPEGKLVDVWRPVTLMDLMDMRAGLSYPWGDEAANRAAAYFDEATQALLAGHPTDTVTFCDGLGRLPLAFQPGEDWRYSTCADVLGAVVELVSGKTFSRFLREEFFEPLGMADTGFFVPADKRDRFVTNCRKTPEGLAVFDQMHLFVGKYDEEPAFASGGAGLVSTLDDYARFAAMLLRGGELDGRRYLAPATVRWLTSARMPGEPEEFTRDGYVYRKLMRVCAAPSRVSGLARMGEYGWDGWLGTYFANFPDLDMTLLLGQNKTDTGTSDLTRKVRNTVLAALG